MGDISMATYSQMQELATTLTGGFDGVQGAPPVGITGNPGLDAAIEGLGSQLLGAAQALQRMSTSAGSGVQRVIANYQAADTV